MDFVVEDLSPVRKKITVTADAVEVDAGLDAAMRHFRKDLAMPGFRKGKVPTSVVERRFAEDIKARVVENYLGQRFDAYLREAGIVPLSRPEYDGGSIERGKGFTCTVSFDVLPAFELPPYVGLPVEQASIDVPATEVDDMMHRLQSNMAEESEVTEARHPLQGEGVDVDFAGFENGEPVPDVKGEHFRVVLGEGQVLPDFEAVVRSAVPGGDEVEGAVTFPEDYGHPDLAGKTITMRVKLHAVFERVVPELSEEFAKKMGQESLEKLREAVADSLKGRRTQSVKAQAQQKLMDGLLEKVDFPLPETLVRIREERILGDARMRLEQQEKAAGQTQAPAEDGAASALDATIEAMRPEAHKEAEVFTRMHILLMSIAHKENLTVSQQEVDMQLYSMAMRSGQDFTKLREAYERSGLMDELFERIQADKAMDFIYEKAAISTVDATSEAGAAAETSNA